MTAKAPKSLHMETTKVKPEKTAMEIQALLGNARVSAIQTDYEDGEIVALSFEIVVNNERIPFRLPVRSDWLFQYFQNKRTWPRDFKEADLAKAKRVAWRQIYRWIQAQLALVDVGMVTVQEVFLPHMQTGINETLYQRLEAGGFKQLPAPTEKRT